MKGGVWVVDERFFSELREPRDLAASVLRTISEVPRRGVVVVLLLVVMDGDRLAGMPRRGPKRSGGDRLRATIRSSNWLSSWLTLARRELPNDLDSVAE